MVMICFSCHHYKKCTQKKSALIDVLSLMMIKNKLASMRLWHYKLIQYLPRSQLLAQWRELNLIFRQEPNHILINFIYKEEYKDKKDLLSYSNIVIEEMKYRGYHINYGNYDTYFQGITTDIAKPFPNYQDGEYLTICFYNLKEKYMRGQKDFSNDQYEKMLSVIGINKKHID